MPPPVHLFGPFRVHLFWPLTPVHASWLNQIEIYFSIVQRKVLTPMEVTDQAMLTTRLLNFQDYYQETAQPFSWKFTTADLKKRLEALHNFMTI